jgi:hypothetical protein
MPRGVEWHLLERQGNESRVLPVSMARERSQDRQFPPAQGVRVAWEELPGRVRSAVESRLGAKVRKVEPRAGGFSPGFAGILEDAHGGRTFVKAVGPRPNPEAPEIYRHEVLNLGRLPTGLPVPKFLWSWDHNGWVALGLEVVEGRHPRLPWERAELDQVLRGWKVLADLLTPAPPGFPSLSERGTGLFVGWRTLASTGGLPTDPLAPRLDPWAVEHLAELGRVESEWPAACRGNTLLHFDLRADNVLLTDRGAIFVDWPHACVGASWVDPLAMLPSVAMQGGPPPWELWGRIPGTENVDPHATLVVTTAIAGFFLSRSLRPPPPGLPTVRRFQRAQGDRALEWLRRMW